jgi:DNA invertase Pin-like site-specific DNA recombinase
LYPIKNTSNNEETKEPVKKVAAYCRVSSSNEEQLNSFNAQVNYYKKYICDNPDYEFAGIYADEGISGTDIKQRKAFNEMIKEAEEGKIEMIITKSISRFGRNTIDTLNSIRELKELGVDVYFEKENIHTINSEGELLITLLSALAQQTSKSQSENVKWGIRKQYERGNIKSVGSGKFLGYNKDEEGNLIIDDKEADIVKRIYKEFLDGYGSHQIANRLTKEKVPMTFGGKGWCASHIKRVLTNEKYKGDFRFQKTYNTSYLTKKRAKNNGELSQYYFENTHPAIIGKETWQLVQLEFKRQEEYKKKHHLTKSGYHNRNNKFPFSGRITCGTCGHTYMQMTDEDGNKYFRCKTFQGSKGTPIQGREFTPKPQKRWSTNPSVIKRRKDPPPRQMYCTDIKIDKERVERAFIEAFNSMVDKMDRIKEGAGLLQNYRVKDLKKLLEKGKIEYIDKDIVRRVLESIVVDENGELEVRFLAGVGVRLLI